jgi:hypothetical protein
MITNKIYDNTGTLVRRTVTSNGWTFVQVREASGGWWNITATRTTGR